MKKKEFISHIIREYLDLIKESDPITHDYICKRLGIQPYRRYPFRISLTSIKWRELRAGDSKNEILDEILKEPELEKWPEIY